MLAPVTQRLQQRGAAGIVGRLGCQRVELLLVLGQVEFAHAFLAEQALAAEPDVLRARVNLTARRLSIRWRGDAAPVNRPAPASVAAIIPNLWAKLGLLALMVAWILFMMVPDNPLRALFYTVAQGGVTLLAILLTQVIELRWERLALMRQTSPASPAHA